MIKGLFKKEIICLKTVTFFFIYKLKLHLVRTQRFVNLKVSKITEPRTANRAFFVFFCIVKFILVIKTFRFLVRDRFQSSYLSYPLRLGLKFEYEAYSKSKGRCVLKIILS